MIVLFTDFGPAGPYVGQMKAVLHRTAPGVPVIELFNDAPAFDPMLAAYLLAAYAPEFPRDAVFLCVVDPGVGSARAAAMVEADGRWFVGPENGLFEPIVRRAAAARWFEITWRPEKLSASFHGRDLFAPVAARLAARGPEGEVGNLGVARELARLRRPDWPDDLPRIVYVDHFGNAMTGLRASELPPTARLEAGGHVLARARTFAEAPTGEPFWYENANGLAELAVNRGRVAEILSLSLGDPVRIV
ncbi:MAG: S-adenosyl-l-methionine hydroxide adenosyltransferase family protein [Alphaproteobacteria bacterium]